MEIAKVKASILEKAFTRVGCEAHIPIVESAEKFKALPAHLEEFLELMEFEGLIRVRFEDGYAIVKLRVRGQTFLDRQPKRRMGLAAAARNT